VRRLGGQLGDVVEVDVVFGPRRGSHYELQTLVFIRGGSSIAAKDGRRDARLPMPG
jgi:hypothetical protein